jgi:hypothetical protein
MAQNDALDEETLRRVLNVQEVVVWAVGDPAWLPPETKKALSQPAKRLFAGRLLRSHAESSRRCLLDCDCHLLRPMKERFLCLFLKRQGVSAVGRSLR